MYSFAQVLFFFLLHWEKTLSIPAVIVVWFLSESMMIENKTNIWFTEKHFCGCEFVTWKDVFWFIMTQRDDTEVQDEPLYAAYLKSTGADRPYRDELLSKMVCQ